MLTIQAVMTRKKIKDSEKGEKPGGCKHKDTGKSLHTIKFCQQLHLEDCSVKVIITIPDKELKE